MTAAAYERFLIDKRENDCPMLRSEFLVTWWQMARADDFGT
jgi:hypothetical protein